MTLSWSSSGWDVHLDWRPDTGARGLAEAIRAAIRDRRLTPGTAMPSTRELAKDLGIARGTVTRVYADLSAEGYLHTSQGAATKVRDLHPAAPVSAPRLRAAEPAVHRGFAPGSPDVSLFPRDRWLSATRRVLQRAPTALFGYPDERGSVTLREALAGYLARTRGVLADPERIVVCAGFSHAMALLARVLRDRGAEEIAFECPSLPQFRAVAKAAAEVRIAGVPVDEHGLRVSELDSPAVVLTPAHQYPTGVPLAPDRRTELTRWATRTGAMVIEDDYDGEFRFDRQQVGALQALAPERVAYVGTASKTLAPGLRIGWLVLPRTLVEPVRAAINATGWRPPALEQAVLAELISSGGYDQHIRRCRGIYRARREKLLDAIPDWLVPHGIAAGLQVLLRLPESGPGEAAVAAAARRRGLGVEMLGRHWIGEGPHPQGIVVGYATPAEHAFGPTLQTFLDVLAEVSR
ncbi:PLP-dependent aminotransferase family protein [Amycolatopsis nigrescens]|uniref:MocR-like pyridoxine biosynthesis transcription factor PdxR n=1 Tax=Amycolatopsis nigrescens TaxID=381445 RepID=UPI0003653DB3|nr:PLP-dependent aminotransferase family protein [Amycolatopsis nigrescens]